jgi:hypothetical protein
VFGHLHASPERQRRLREPSARARDQDQRRPTGGRRGRPLEQVGGDGGMMRTGTFSPSLLSCNWVTGFSASDATPTRHMALAPKGMADG